MYRSSIERHNAPYRGVSSRQDVVNFDLATMHDLFFIQKTSGDNPSFLGHQDFIQNNLKALFVGETNVKTNLPTAGKILCTLDTIGEQDFTRWQKLEDTQVTKEGINYRMKSSGNFIKVGLKSLFTVDPGDILQMRLKIKKVAGVDVQIALGALNYDSEGDELDFYPLDDFGSFLYLDKRLSFSSRQDVELVFYLAYETKQGLPVEVLVSDFSVKRLEESTVSIQGVEENVKPLIATSILDTSFVEDQYERGEHK